MYYLCIVNKKIIHFRRGAADLDKNLQSYMEKKENMVLIDTTNCRSYSDYVEFCEMNDLPVCGEDSNDYFNYLDDSRTEDYDAFFDKCSYEKQCNVPVVITGGLGLWNGKPVIVPVRCETVVDAIHRCLYKCDDMRIKYGNGIIYLRCFHHDGTNSFVIRPLTEKGNDPENWEHDGCFIGDEFTDDIAEPFPNKKYLF